jgi:hypothetical protein
MADLPKKSGPNAKPMLSKHIAPGIAALLDAVDMPKVINNPKAMRARKYLLELAEYLNGPEYAKLSEKRINNTRASKQRANQKDTL